ncbi:MAG: hypothetical protein GX975_04720 [Clostridiales bacterium]|nr:hypothetical protein [Clostridiales bacterium]
MKQFLVLLAILPLMLVFFVQFSMDQINSSRIGLLSDMVYAAKEEAKQEGCFTQKIRDDLRANIARQFDIDPDTILIDATETVQYRLMSADGYSESDWERGLIHYRVEVPIGEMMAGRRLFGIEADENTYMYVIDSYTASEKLP